MNETTKQNIDQQEIAKFDVIAGRWWDPDGEFKPLHDINPLRLDYVDAIANLNGKRVVDIGCGGGILSEGMAQRGADVTGIDMAEAALTVAKLHLHESGVNVDYQLCTAENLAEQQPGQFDVVTCMELLEHVPDPASIISACARLAKPNGHVFLSTINRNMKSYVFAIVGAEYVLNMLPRGTHDYSKFIRPSELETWARHAGLMLTQLKGIVYNPLTRTYSLSSDIDVNYLAHCVPADV
jgi:2-polyprenyl-6-hydroxyphenyl methylase/3-demethylubiquinone-9 3-methyltransferase